MSSVDFAIITAVPLQHLLGGETVAREDDFVALGTDTERVFEEVDAMRGDERVPVLFYASQQEGGAPETHWITWVGWYVGCVHARGGQHPLGMMHRPPTTAYDGAWRLFYHVEQLSRLSEDKRIAIASLKKYRKRSEYRANAAVRSPGLVVRPSPV